MLSTGKLSNELLREIVLQHIKPQRSEVIIRPCVGEDCAVIDFGDYDCHMSTDPITASSSRIGSLAVHISCNDIASNGVAPLGIMLTLLLPEGTTESNVEEVMRQASEAAAQLNVEIIGGHTEITPAVNKPVIVSTAIGRVLKPDCRKKLSAESVAAEQLEKIKAFSGEMSVEGHFNKLAETVKSEEPYDSEFPDSMSTGVNSEKHRETTKPADQSDNGCAVRIPPPEYRKKLRKAILSSDEYMGNREEIRPGDVLYLTKTAGLEGTGIIAADFKDALNGVLSQAEFSRAEHMFNDVSVVHEGVIAGILGFTAMHDVTEGGVLGALWEICQINAVGAVIYEKQIPIEDITRKICSHFGLDALRLISSGAMLIATRPEKSEILEQVMADAGIRLSGIGEIREATHGIHMVSSAGTILEVAPPGSDEIYKLATIAAIAATNV